MTSRRSILCAVLALAACSSTAIAATAGPPNSYTCTQVDVPGATSTQLWRLNNNSYIAADTPVGAYLYNPNTGVWTPLPAPPASSGYTAADIGALDVNDNGVIVGGASDPNVNNGIEQGFILSNINDPTTYKFYSWVDPLNSDNNNTEFRGISDSGLIAGYAVSTGTYQGTELSSTGLVFNPSNAPIGNIPPGFNRYQPTLSDGSVATFTQLDGVNSAGLIAGSSQSNTIRKEGVLVGPNSLATKEVPNPNFLLALRGINDLDPLSNGNCDQGSCVRAAGWGSVNGSLLSFTLDYDAQTGFVQAPQIVDCSAQIPASAGALVIQGINNADTLTGAYTDPATGLGHGVIAYAATTAPASTCSAGEGGCNLSNGAIPHSVVGGPSSLPGTVTESTCAVAQDPRIVQYGTCTGHALPVSQICPGFGNTVIPDTLCGGAGPSGSGFELVDTAAEGVDALSGIYVESEAFANVALGGTPPACPATVVGWAPRSGSAVEGVVPEGNNMLELTNGCGSSKTGSRGLSIYGIGLTLNTAALPGNTLADKLRNMTAEKYTNLYESIAAGNMTRPERFKVNACVAVSEVLFALRSYCPAAKAIVACDAAVAKDVTQYSGSPSDPNVWGDIRGRLANLYLTINTRLAGNPANTAWPPTNLPSCR